MMALTKGAGPDFVGIGAQKAGTTWLHDNLEIQPEFWLPPEKELHFFNRVAPNEELLGVEARAMPPVLDRYRPALESPSVEVLRWLRQYHFGAPSTDWYRSLFPPSLVRGRIAGEITPAYSTLDERGVRFAHRVLKAGVRIFIILRNPIERTWSGLKMEYRWRELSISATELDVLLEHAAEASHRLRGDYSRIVPLWRDIFGERFRVFLYDDLVADPVAFLRAVYAYLGGSGAPNLSRVGSRSNADPSARRIPTAVQEQLRERFSSEIEVLDVLVPGVEERWLR